MECLDHLIYNSLDGRGRLGEVLPNNQSPAFLFPHLKNKTVKLWEAVDEVNPFRCIGVVKHQIAAWKFFLEVHSFPLKFLCTNIKLKRNFQVMHTCKTRSIFSTKNVKFVSYTSNYIDS
jgi:hypothetical protein